MTHEVLEALRAARRLIEKPDKWTKNTFARKWTGEECELESSEACSFCIGGALARVTPNRPRLETLCTSYLQLATKWDNPDTFPDAFNDEPARKHEEILELFDKAIRLAAASH